MTLDLKSTDLEVKSIWGLPFPKSIKEVSEMKETQGENDGAGSLTARTTTTTVSDSSLEF